MIHALSEYQFMQNAFIASLLASIVCGMIGVIVVEKKLVMMSGGIAHTAYGGVGLGYFSGLNPSSGRSFFHRRSTRDRRHQKKRRRASGHHHRFVLVLGMALGIVFIALMPGYPPDLNSYLFGNILSVTQADLYLMVLLTLPVFSWWCRCSTLGKPICLMKNSLLLSASKRPFWNTCC